jgi:hypothetical protein
MQRDDKMSVPRGVDGPGGPVASLNESGEGHRRELVLGKRLIETGPERRPLRGVLADGERVEELHPGRVRDGREERRGAVIGIVVRALEQRRVAVEEIALPVDQAVTPAGNTTAV